MFIVKREKIVLEICEIDDYIIGQRLGGSPIAVLILVM